MKSFEELVTKACRAVDVSRDTIVENRNGVIVRHLKVSPELDGESLELFKQLIDKKYPDRLSHRDLSRNAQVSFLLSSLVRCAFVEEDDSFRWCERSVGSAVSELETYLTSDRVRISFCASLANLQSDFLELEVSPGLNIRAIDISEFERVFGSGYANIHVWHDRIHSRRKFVLEGAWDRIVGLKERPFEDHHTASARLYEPLITAFQLLGPGSISVAEIVFDCDVKVHPFIFGKLGSQIGEYNYEFNEAQLPELQALLNALGKKVKKPGRKKMELALSRITEGRNRKSHEDRILDAMIALEALLVPGKGENVTMRFSLNYAALGKTIAERLERRKFAKSLYDLRSRVAHGENPDELVEIDGFDKMNLRDASELALQTAADTARMLLQQRDIQFWDGGAWYKKIFGGP